MTQEELDRIIQVSKRVIEQSLIADVYFDRREFAESCSVRIGWEIVQENIKNKEVNNEKTS